MYCISISLLPILIISSVDPLMAKELSISINLFESIQEFLGKNLKNVKNFFSVAHSNKHTPFSKVSGDSYLSINALKYGYKFKEYKVPTDDGYILRLHRISHRNYTKKSVDVFLMHGLMDSSDSWVIQGPGRALAYVLADEGYDVWMGNARGNQYSNNHVNLTTTDTQYWKFSWEEVGLYDLPAMIDYILRVKSTNQLFYVGHSQGTTSFYVMASMKPAYNNKIKMMFSLSPVAYMGNAKSPILRMFSPANKVIAHWLSNFNVYSPSVEYFNKILSMICYVIPRCDNLLYLIGGDNHKFINETLLPVIFSHMPSGSSTLQFVHYGQLVESWRFCRYDFGEEINKQMYKSATPPAYELDKITTPVVLFHSENDWLSNPSDVKVLISELPNVDDTQLIEDYNHWDFLYAANAREIIYSQIIERINKF